MSPCPACGAAVERVSVGTAAWSCGTDTSRAYFHDVGACVVGSFVPSDMTVCAVVAGSETAARSSAEVLAEHARSG